MEKKHQRASKSGGKNGKDGRFWRPKSESEKDKEWEDCCEQWLARLIGLGIFAFTMFGFFLNLGDYFMRSSMENIDTNIDLDGRVAVITGGTDGIGREVAISLALAGAKVYVGAKNITSSEFVLNTALRKSHNSLFGKMSDDDEVQVLQQGQENDIIAFDDGDDDDASNTRNGGVKKYKLPEGLHHITAFELKLHVFKSVKQFATNVLNDIDEPISILINNAGTKGGKYACAPTKDGYNWNVQINYLSHFLLTQLFLPSLKKRYVCDNIFHPLFPYLYIHNNN
jgi:NAD(P)-dependent dehydrogenase (short-subunit alcohol dehydrogenase family)